MIKEELLLTNKKMDEAEEKEIAIYSMPGLERYNWSDTEEEKGAGEEPKDN